MAGDVAAGIGVVAPHPRSPAPPAPARPARITAGAQVVPCASPSTKSAGTPWRQRSCPGIEWQSTSRQAPNCRRVASTSSRKRGVERLPAQPHPPLGLGEAQLAAIDRLPGGDHARDRAQPGADPGAGACSPTAAAAPRTSPDRVPTAPGWRRRRRAGRWPPAAARRAGGAVANSSSTKAVLAAAQRQRVQPRGGEEFGRVVPAGMGGDEHQRQGLPLRPGQQEGWRQRILGRGGREWQVHGPD